MGINSPVENVTSRLPAERDALLAFVSLLEAEQQALIEGDTDTLQGLADKKIQFAAELTQMANLRRSALLACGAGEGTGKEMLVWLKVKAVGSVPVWLEIQRLADRAYLLNRSNGTLIQTRLRYNQQMLTALHGAANSVGNLYGRDGQPHLASPGRTLGSV